MNQEFIPIKTNRLIIDEFKTSDYEALREIAFNINHNADVHQADGYCPFYTFQVDKNEPDRNVIIRQKVADFIIKAERERNQQPRSTYRMAVRLLDGQLIGNATVDMLPFQDNGDVYIEMTVTSPMCPVAGVLPEQAAQAVASVEGIGEVEVRIVWEPAWSMDMLSDEAKEMFELF